MAGAGRVVARTSAIPRGKRIGENPNGVRTPVGMSRITVHASEQNLRIGDRIVFGELQMPVRNSVGGSVVTRIISEGLLAADQEFLADRLGHAGGRFVVDEFVDVGCRLRGGTYGDAPEVYVGGEIGFVGATAGIVRGLTVDTVAVSIPVAVEPGVIEIGGHLCLGVAACTDRAVAVRDDRVVAAEDDVEGAVTVHVVDDAVADLVLGIGAVVFVSDGADCSDLGTVAAMAVSMVGQGLKGGCKGIVCNDQVLAVCDGFLPCC